MHKVYTEVNLGQPCQGVCQDSLMCRPTLIASSLARIKCFVLVSKMLPVTTRCSASR